MGYGVTATHETLTLVLQVRVLLSQPNKEAALGAPSVRKVPQSGSVTKFKIIFSIYRKSQKRWKAAL